MLAVLSWAGEKMPWNVIHIALPMTLLAGSFAGDALDYLERRWHTWDRRVRVDTSAGWCRTSDAAGRRVSLLRLGKQRHL